MKIKEYRLKLRLKAEDVAEKMNMHLKEYMEIEHKKRELTLSEHYRLKVILKVKN